MSDSTTSISFPKMFDVSRNTTSIVHDTKSIVNRVRLLILTEPTELYMNPGFGVGLKRHLWQYNNSVTKELIRDRIVEQLRLYEPCVIPDETTISDGLLFTGGDTTQVYQEYNQLRLTVVVVTTFGDTVEVTLNGD